MKCPHCNCKITEHDEKINKVISRFNFDKVHKTMAALKWKWRDIGQPSINEMKSTARRLLINASESEHGNSCTGGFQAEMHKDGEFTLSFVVTESTSNEY